MIHNIKHFIAAYFIEIKDFIYDHLDTGMDVFSLGFLFSATIRDLCKFNMLGGEITHVIGWILTIGWMAFRCLSAFEDYRMKRSSRKLQDEIIEESKK